MDLNLAIQHNTISCQLSKFQSQPFLPSLRYPYITWRYRYVIVIEASAFAIVMQGKDSRRTLRMAFPFVDAPWENKLEKWYKIQFHMSRWDLKYMGDHEEEETWGMQIKE